MSDSPPPEPSVEPSGSATEKQLSPPPAGVPARTAPLTVAARYGLREELARGGMGVVYRAHDRDLDREVGLKTLIELPTDARVVARFREEARITGQLQHPNIPPVHDLGTLPDGRPFLAMKLIKGKTLAALLKERPDPSEGRGRFLAIFEHIAQGVAYAHAHKVIHRDLKPANVMVGAFGEVQVMDWGLAKVLSAAGAEEGESTVIRAPRIHGDDTEYGLRMGTPAYMPPEQAAGAIDRIDARSDVFSLGAVLCAVLTGRPAYRGGSAEATLRLAERADLAEALGALDQCGAEPELIALCKRCLAPEPADRPADAGAVAKSVAHLRAETELRARRAERERSAAEARAAEEVNTRREAEARAAAERARANEHHKRRRVQLWLAGAVLLLATGVAGGAFWKHQKDEEALRRQLQFGTDLAREELSRERAETDARDRRRDLDGRLARNRLLLDELLARAEAAMVADDAPAAADALAEADKRFREGGAEGQNERLTRARTDLELLNELDRLDELKVAASDGKVIDDRGRDAARGALFRRVGVAPGQTPPEVAAGRITGSLLRERLLAAMEQWALAAATRDDATARSLMPMLRAADPDPYRCDVRAAAVARDADALRAALARPEALQQPARFAVAVGFYLGGPFDRREAILLAAYRRQPRNFFVLTTLGDIYGLEAAGGHALAYHRLSAAERKALAGERAGWYRAALAVRPANALVRSNLGNALRAKGSLDEAVAVYRDALALDPRVLELHANLSLALSEKGDHRAALAAAHEAVRLDPRRAWAHLCVGNVLKEQGDETGAETAFRAAIACDPSWFAPHYCLGVVLLNREAWAEGLAATREAVRLAPEFTEAHANVGTALHRQGDLDGAIAAYHEAIKHGPMYAIAHLNLGMALHAKRDFAGEIVAYREAARLDPELVKKHKLNAKLARAHNDLGQDKLTKGDTDGAVAAFREAIGSDRKHAGAWGNLGKALIQKGDPDDAAYSLLEAIALDLGNAQLRNDLGTARVLQENWDAAAAAFREAIARDPKHATAHANLGRALLAKNDLDGAIAACRQAIRLEPGHTMAHNNLGAALLQNDDLEGAIAAFQKATECDPKYATAHYNLGVARYRNGSTAEAVAALRESIRLSPEGAETYNWLGVALFEQEELGAAAAAFREAIKRDPKHTTAHANLGAALLRRKDFDGAVSAYREAIRLAPNSPAECAKLGEAYTGAGDFAAAVASYRESLRLNPKQPAVQKALDEVLRRGEKSGP